MRTPNTQCEICGALLYRRPSTMQRHTHICCRGCRSALYKKYKCYSIKGLTQGRAWNKGMNKANGDDLSYGRPRSKETKDKIAKKLRGRILSESHRMALSESKMRFYDRIGRSIHYDRGWAFARWKKAIFKRDGFACQKCGSPQKLRAHHILSWKDYPELRFVFTNGITLCESCHFAIHKGKTRNNPL